MAPEKHVYWFTSDSSFESTTFWSEDVEEGYTYNELFPTNNSEDIIYLQPLPRPSSVLYLPPPMPIPLEDEDTF